MNGTIEVKGPTVIPETRSPARCDICGHDDSHVAWFRKPSEITVALSRSMDICEQCLVEACVQLRRAKLTGLCPEIKPEEVRENLRNELGRRSES